MATPRKPHKPSNNEKAAARIEALIRAGVVVKVEASRGYWTVGPYHMATGKSGFAALPYNGAGGILTHDQEFWSGPNGAAEAARAIVDRCGSTRAREAAEKSERKVARHIGPF